MKVFFTASQRGKKEFGENYKKICDEIKKEGFEILEDDIFEENPQDFFKHIQEGGRKAQVDLYQKKVKAIQEADINVFECSVHSLSIGFIIQKSLEYHKPTIVLYYKDNEPFFLAGIDDEKLIVKNYTEKNLKKLLKELFEIAKERRDKRFNFFLSPKLLDYLEKASTREGITKSKLIRDLIVDDMRENTA